MNHLTGIPDAYRIALKEGRDPDDAILEKRGYIDSRSISQNTDGVLTVDFVITTGTVDRDQDTINPDGWDFKSFEKNPVVLWAHDHGRPPVANSAKIWRDGDAWKSTAKFMPYELSAFSYSIGQMYKAGYLHAVSVGFRAREAKRAPDDETRPWGIDFISQELLEYSCCPVPSNPEALVAAKNAGIDTSSLLDYVVESLDGVNFIPRDKAEQMYRIISAKSVVTVPKAAFTYKTEMDAIRARMEKL